MIFHANLNYAYLTPERYEFVIRQSYEMTIDILRKRFPDVKYVFEASGYTIEQIALKAPDVLEKLKDAISRGQCEFMGSPYAHPMLPNFPKMDGLWSIRFSNAVYDKYLSIQPASFWNPECGWRSYVPAMVAEENYRNMIGDFEAYSRSCGPDSQPLRPEIYEKEYSDEAKFYNFGFKYDLPGHEQAIHFPFNKVKGLPEGKMRMFLRTDRIAQFGVRYFMGMEGYTLDKYLELIAKYSEQPSDEPEGALIIFADDAEYVGTNGWFRLKYQNKPDNVFEATPDSRQKLIDLVDTCSEMGAFTTFDNACQNLPPLSETITFDDDSAWHGGRASTWANTPMARLLRPWQDLVREKLLKMESTLDDNRVKKVWYHLTNSYNSDGQWPPTLPDAPHIIHPFNYCYCFENLLKAEMLVGGIDRSQLRTDPIAVLTEILSLQQDLIEKKAMILLNSSDDGKINDAKLALYLIGKSRNVSSLEKNKLKVLHPSEYTIRAEALVQSRQLVGGIIIETNQE